MKSREKKKSLTDPASSQPGDSKHQHELELLRKKLEETQRKLENLEKESIIFKLFAENAGQGFGMARLDGSIVYVNPALCRLLEEESPENSCKKGFPSYYSPEHQKKLREDILPQVLREGYWTGELALAGIRGKVTPTLENFFLLRDARGEPLYFADVITDISEQKEMSIALIEYSPNMIFINAGGRVVFANKQCEEVLGYSRNEFYSPDFDFLQITAPEYRELVREKFRQHMTGKEVTPYEYALLTKDGRKLHTVLSTKLITYEGNPAILGLVTDITERRKAEMALQESEMNLRVILEASKETVFLIDTAGVILAANQTMADRLGKTKEVVVGKNIYDILPPAVRKSRADNMQKAIREKSIVRFEDERDGLWLDSYIYPVLEGDEVTRLVILAIDITQRKKNEQLLRENEALLRATLESIISGILVVNKEGKVTHSNRNFAEMWKIPDHIMKSGDDDQLLGFVLDQLEDPEQFLNKVKELYQTDRVDHDILTFKDGRYFERISHPLLHDGKIGGRVWAFRDITRRISMEQEIRRINEELKESNAAKDKFFSIIAHDLKSPFSGLLGLSEVISDPAEELSIKDMRKYGARLHSLLRNQYHLLQNLLEWSRLQRGGMTFKPERLNLRDHVGHVTDQLAVNYLRKQITLHNEVNPAVIIRADADMLQSVLLNLLSNAIKFTNHGGSVTIRGSASETEIEVSVQDSGIGVGHDRLTTLFELEEVSSTPGTDGEKGTGLGLILCREFIEKHGGTIRAESDPGKGSTFRFTIPVK